MSSIRKYLAIIPESRDKMGETKREGRGNKNSEIWSKLSFLWLISSTGYIVW